jgi:hypothetical protein
MTGPSFYLSQSSSRPLRIFILVDPHVHDFISYYTGILLNRISEGNQHRVSLYCYTLIFGHSQADPYYTSKRI